MPDNQVGYLEFDGKFARLQSARCCFDDGRLDVEGLGPKCKLHLFGIPFKDAASIAEISGKSFGPDSDRVRSDPIAEGGIETKKYWLSFQSLEVKCRSYDPELQMISVFFNGEVEDYESGRSGPIDGSVRCSIVSSL